MPVLNFELASSLFGRRPEQRGLDVPERMPAGPPGFFVDATGGRKGEDGAFFQVEGNGITLAAHEQRGEGAEVRFMADQGQAVNCIRSPDTIGNLSGVVLGQKSGRFNQGVVQFQAIGEEARGFERAGEGAVPEVGGAQRAVALKESYEPGAILAAAVAQRTQRIIRRGGGMGVAD